MTPLDLVKHYFPDADDEEAASVLWNCTGFPAFWGEGRSPAECLNIQLHRIARRSNGNAVKAICISLDDLDQAMKGD